MDESALRTALSSLLPEGRARRLAGHFVRLPDPQGALYHLARYAAAAGRMPDDDAVLSDLLTIAGHSPYLGGLLGQHPEFLEVLASGGPAAGPRSREDLEQDLARYQFIRASQDLGVVLRLFKQREYLRIALADFLGTTDLAAILRALSQLADVLLGKAVVMARAALEARYGRPTSRDDQGHPEAARFVVLALGKLGGEELNYSSDIDLIYLFSRDGETSGTGTAGGAVITNREFFARLAADVTRLIAGTGPEGQAFRVDLGLRPGGRDGDPAISTGAALAYYRNWAQPWERQALIKSRPAAGDLDLGHQFVCQVAPLVYTPAPDPYVTQEIAAMKDRIDAKLAAEGRSETDIKLGRGGIRELEFAVQALQLQRGGADPWLRQGNTLLALHRLAERGVFGYGEYSALGQAYTFLRDLEHRLQLGQNRQTAALPTDPAERRILARRMRFLETQPQSEAQSLDETLERHRGTVRAFYDMVFGRGAQPEIAEEADDIWLDRLDEERLLARLRQSGLPDPEPLLKPVRMIRKLLQPAALSPESRRALRRAGPALLAAAAGTPSARRALTNLEKLLSALLAEPGAIERFLSHREILAPAVRVLGRSDFLAGLLIRHPDILRSLEDRARILRRPGSGEYLEDMMKAAAVPGGPRVRAAELRRRHQEALATIALRDINSQATVRETLKSLSDLADATLETALLLARREMQEKGQTIPPGLRVAVLGMGRLGYREMDYGSDLDLVFLRDGAEDAENSGRAAQKLFEGVIRILSTISRDGQLYRVDLRLRPSGPSGPLVTSLGSLLEYFRSGAEIWEMQSFLKARPAAGDPVLGARAFLSVETLILQRARELGQTGVATAVEQMRRRLSEPSRSGGRPSIKLGDGGLMDIHFTIEYLQLCHGVPGPPDKDTLRMLTFLADQGRIDEARMRLLYQGYLFLRRLEHEMRLLNDRPPETLPADLARLSELAMCLEVDAEPGPIAAARLMEAFRSHTAAVRRVYQTIVPMA